MVSLIPAAPLGVAQDSRCDLFGPCGDAGHGTLNPVRWDGTGDHHVLTFFPEFRSYVQSWLCKSKKFPLICTILRQDSTRSECQLGRNVCTSWSDLLPCLSEHFPIGEFHRVLNPKLDFVLQDTSEARLIATTSY